jgi:dTDP-glucose pyrophosphorylase
MKNNDTPMAGVILAAGKGSRMGHLPTRLPKPALPVLDRPILHHQLETLAALGIPKAYIVVGHRGVEIVRQVERMPVPGLDIEYVEQEEALGIAHCVGRLEGRLDSPFMLFLGDIYFHAPRIGEMLGVFRQPGVDGVLGAIEESDPAVISKNFSISADADGRATGVVEKPRFPRSNLKGVGVYVFGPVVFDAIRRTPRTALRNEYEITDSIQIMIQDGCDVRVSTSIDDDLNVTYPRDLIAANLHVLRYRGLDRHVAESAVLGAGVTVEQSVVGSGARVGDGAALRRTVVFAGAEVPPGAQLDHAIVTEREIVKA